MSGLGLVMMILIAAVVVGALLPAKGGDRTSSNTETTTTRTETNVLSGNKLLSDNNPQFNFFSEVHNYFVSGEGAKGTETHTTTAVDSSTTTNQANTEVTGDRNQMIPGTNFPMRLVFHDGIERCWTGGEYTEEACK